MQGALQQRLDVCFSNFTSNDAVVRSLQDGSNRQPSTQVKLSTKVKRM